MDCAICLDTLKPSSKPTVCAACTAVFCKSCLEKHLLTDSSKDPCCAACSKPWAHTFLAEALTGTFRKGSYKRYRESVLLEREKARLPDTQEDAVRYRDALAQLKDAQPRIDALQSQYRSHPAYIAYTTATKSRSFEELEAHFAEIAQLRKKMKDETRPIRSQLGKIHARLLKARQARDGYGALLASEPAHEPARRTFTMRCVVAGCEGFVSTAYKCGLCDAKVCRACHTVKADTHACDPDAVASVATLKKEARPCPKCAAPISKIDGCDQIWCTLCKTAFSWDTGKIDEGTIHNPHYYQWMRATGQAIPRPQGCVANFDYIAATLNALRDVVVRSTSLSDDEKAELQRKNAFVYNSVPSYHHIRQVLRTYRPNNEEQLRVLRVQRLVGEIDDATWKKRLQMLEKAAEKMRAWAQLLEMYVNCYADIVQPTSVSDTNALTATYDSLRALQVYVAKEAYKITKLFDCVASQSVSYIWDKDTWAHLMAFNKKAKAGAGTSA